jgi:hypothetical protein
MIRSTVIVEGYDLDLLEDIAADFTYSIQDIREPDKRTTDFSKTIQLPGTPKNNALFAHIFDLNIENDYNPSLSNIGYNFNPNKVAKTLLLVDGIQVFQGVLRVLKVSVEDGIITYDTNVLGRLSDILFAMGDKKLSDINFSDLNHELRPDHITDVWYNPTNYPYTYPLIDYGLTTDGINYPIENFAPAIYVKEYIDRMFHQNGFTYKCPLFSLPYFRSLIIPATEKSFFTQGQVAGKYLTMSNRYFSMENRRSGNSWREITFEFTNEQVDPYNMHTGTNLHIQFTRDLDTSIQFNLRFRYLSNNERDAELWVILNNDRDSRFVNETVNSGAFQNMIVEIPRRQWTSGDTLIVAMNIPPKSSLIANADECHWLMPSPTDESAYPIDVGAEVTMSNFISKTVTQKDFFKSIILMHNLYVFTDPDNDKNLLIVPQNQFYDTYAGNAVDWTYKVDYSKAIEVTPMGELTAREFQFTYKEDSDYWNADRYKKKYNEIYGQRKYVVDNDFEKDTKKIELIFSPTPSIQGDILGFNNKRVVPHIYKVTNGLKERDAFNIRVLQYGGMIDSLQTGGNSNYPNYATWYIVDAVNDRLVTATKYPYAGMFNNPVTPTRDLCFGPPLEVFFDVTQGYPDVTLYRYYWQQYINEVANKDSKLWKAYVYLTPNDINQLDFKRLVKIDNTYFKLNKIDGYNPLTNDVTRVELFKTIVQVEVVKAGFILHEDGGYLLHSDGSSRIPYA